MTAKQKTQLEALARDTTGMLTDWDEGFVRDLRCNYQRKPLTARQKQKLHQLYAMIGDE